MDWQTKTALILVCISAICKLIALKLKETERESKSNQVSMNREQRRHPNGKVSAQKFKHVNAKGRQKQGNGRAVRGW